MSTEIEVNNCILLVLKTRLSLLDAEFQSKIKLISTIRISNELTLECLLKF